LAIPKGAVSVCMDRTGSLPGSAGVTCAKLSKFVMLSERWFSSGRQLSPLRDECIEGDALIVDDAGAPDYMRRL
jgi:hypothetical protein